MCYVLLALNRARVKDRKIKKMCFPKGVHFLAKNTVPMEDQEVCKETKVMFVTKKTYKSHHWVHDENLPKQTRKKDHESPQQ